MEKNFKKIVYTAVFLLFTAAVFADEMRGMGHGEYGEKEHEGGFHGGEYHRGMSPCGIGKEVMMQKMQKMQMDEKECMSCIKTEMVLKNAKTLELTEDQVSKMRALNSDCSKNNIKNQAEIDLLRIDKKDMLMKDEVNLEDVKKILNRIAELESANDLSCIETNIKIRKLLNEKQNEKLKEIKKKMM
ncbi:MAG: hypothetical protein AB1498_05935 [bacterium]